MEKYHSLEQKTEEPGFFTKLSNYARSGAQYATLIAGLALFSSGCGGGGGGGGGGIPPTATPTTTPTPTPTPTPSPLEEAINRRIPRSTINLTAGTNGTYIAESNSVLNPMFADDNGVSYSSRLAKIFANGTDANTGAAAPTEAEWNQLFADYIDGNEANNELDKTIAAGYGIVIDDVNNKIGIHLKTPYGEFLTQLQLDGNELLDVKTVIGEALFDIYGVNELGGATTYDPVTGEQLDQIVFDQ